MSVVRHLPLYGARLVVGCATWAVLRRNSEVDFPPETCVPVGCRWIWRTKAASRPFSAGAPGVSAPRCPDSQRLSRTEDWQVKFEDVEAESLIRICVIQMPAATFYAVRKRPGHEGQQAGSSSNLGSIYGEVGRIFPSMPHRNTCPGAYPSIKGASIPSPVIWPLISAPSASGSIA